LSKEKQNVARYKAIAVASEGELKQMSEVADKFKQGMEEQLNNAQEENSRVS
jgi:hypothetical protein